MDVVTSRHPTALPFLFLTEMWERLGFYIAQGLLVLYMSGYYGMSDDQSYAIAGLFSGLVYISPFVGGYLADHYFGFRRPIIWGGALLCLGYSLIALTTNLDLFFYALAMIIAGNGLFKPNISSTFGAQYRQSDPRRDAGFTFFYVGINLGSALSGLSGYLRIAYGWHAPFTMAAIGMLIGLTTFVCSRHKIDFQSEPLLKFRQLVVVALGLVLFIGLVKWLFAHTQFNSAILPATGILLSLYLGKIWLTQDTASRKNLLLLYVLILSSILFWALFLQLFASANLYVERIVDKQLFGFPLPTTVFYASEAVFIVLLGPMLASLWHRLGDRNPKPATKFILGLSFTGLAFWILATSTQHIGSNQLISPLWIFAAYFFITVGELLLSPTGLSAISQLAPQKLAGMMMGVWFVATGYGGLFSGMLATIASIPHGEQSLIQKLEIYHSAFLDFAYIALGVAVILALVNWRLQKADNKHQALPSLTSL